MVYGLALAFIACTTLTRALAGRDAFTALTGNYVVPADAEKRKRQWSANPVSRELRSRNSY